MIRPSTESGGTRVAEFINVTKIFKVGTNEIPALKNVSLGISSGEFVVLAGASGSGKSTFLNILGCLDKPTSGEFRLEGKNITKVPLELLYSVRLHQLGFIFQSFNLVPVLTAYENVELPLLFKYSNSALIRQKTENALQKVGLGHRLDHKPGLLSGGEQQRVSIARAIADAPSVLIADEPTANLDSKTSDSIIDLFEELNENDGITVVVASHDPDVIGRARRKVVIQDGSIT